MNKILLLLSFICMSFNFVSAQDKCDVNGDGSVDVKDINMVVGHIMGNHENTNPLIGMWKHTFSTGYILYTFNTDGTYTITEYDFAKSGKGSTETGTYTYFYNTITLTEDGEEPYTLTDVTWISDTEISVKGEKSTEKWTKQAVTPSICPLVGTWKYTFSTGYVLFTFKADGTYSSVEYDNADGKSGKGSTEAGTYTYSYNTITLTEDGEEPYTLTNITWISDTQISVTDEKATRIWNKQSTVSTPIIGSWKYSFDEEGYAILTFNADGTGHYYEFDDGEESIRDFTYTYDTQTNYLSCSGIDSSTITWINSTTFVSNIGDSGSRWYKL